MRHSLYYVGREGLEDSTWLEIRQYIIDCVPLAHEISGYVLK